MEIDQINPLAYGKANSPKKLTLEILKPKQTLELQFKDKEVITFGRAQSSFGYIHIPKSRNVSRQHFFITRRNDEFYINDLGSTNGTFVNGQKITSERELMPGDVIKAADIEMKVSF